jgi:hypothetical protein
VSEGEAFAMTTLREIRATLLTQHAGIRARIAETREAITTTDDERLRQCLGRLADAFRTHNVAEEDALKSVLPTIDAWGKERRDVMLSEHVNENSELYSALVENSTASTAAHVATLLDRMVEHMAVEERTFLGADLLTDEVKTDGAGG